MLHMAIKFLVYCSSNKLYKLQLSYKQVLDLKKHCLFVNEFVNIYYVLVFLVFT
jgi:hypothetical protein